MDLDRYLPVRFDFDTVFNLRDLGGYAAADGRTVRPGVLFRADGLFRLSGEDVARFGELGVRAVLDLRRPDELAADGRCPDLPGLLYRNVNLQRAQWTSAQVSGEQMAGYLADRYTEMAAEGLESGAMGEALRFVATEPGPTVFHCLAGKDRTGVIAALVLSLLGVPDEAVAADYAASQYSEERYLAWKALTRPDLPAPVSAGYACPAGAMLAFLSRLRAEHGSAVAYTERAGLTGEHRAALRDRLLSA